MYLCNWTASHKDKPKSRQVPEQHLYKRQNTNTNWINNCPKARPVKEVNDFTWTAAGRSPDSSQPQQNNSLFSLSITKRGRDVWGLVHTPRNLSSILKRINCLLKSEQHHPPTSPTEPPERGQKQRRVTRVKLRRTSCQIVWFVRTVSAHWYMTVIFWID